MNLTQTTPLGRTGVDVTPLALGTSGWGPLRSGESIADRDARVGALADAFFAGKLPTNYIDTSNEYGGSQSEALIGQALARVGGLPSGQVLQTKLDRNLDTGDFSSAQMRISVEQSLERLGVNTLQVLFLHDPDSIGFDAAMAPGGPVEALVAMKNEGIAAAIGISGGPVDLLKQFVETDLFDALISHNRYTLVDRSADALYTAAHERNVGINNAAPYGAGVLTGDARFAGTYGYRPILPEVQAAVDGISALCAEAGVSLAAAALQFSMRDPRIHSTIIGATSLDRIDDTAREAAEDIPEELWARFDALVPGPEFALDAPRR
ncbi:MAG: D-threo-aldose 1-dehydrogenase [Actinomycetota bacterium]|jgi:D-threo-aldose 1-dehydrogenase|nr:D-threo-aldose 1-dehydrogenase [Glaciihabitans sp.]MDQ1562925.1 D-threo-aldose 1-dehydrogenase [Actinomycetota bacterium]MDQ1573422.1 D-threo-aldose 1-dehydrogenase [Actinomycetota bacterium]